MGSWLDWNLPGDGLDNVKFIILKVGPRIILAAVLSILFAGMDNQVHFNEVITFVLLSGLLIFYLLPPAVDSLYLIRQTGNNDLDDLIILKLLQASKDSSSGIYMLDGSFVVKSYYGKAMKYYDKLKEKYDFKGYDIFRQSKPIKAFNEQYYKVLEKVTWKYIEKEYGAAVIKYGIDNLDAINP